MKDQDYIIPTKTEPVFSAECDYFGTIDGMYKDWLITSINVCGSTFGINFTDSVTSLHIWLQDNPDVIKMYPKAKFSIDVIDGSLKNGEYVRKTVYSITASKAKKYVLRK